MRNHFHFCIRIKEKNEIGYLNSKNVNKTKEIKWAVHSISEDGLIRQPKPVSQLRFLFNAYSKYYNNKYSRHGSLFEKNFGRRVVEDETYLTSLIIYINNNPVKHLHKNTLQNYPWSSFNETVNRSSEICDLEFLWHLFNDEENFRSVHNIRKDEENNWDDYFE